MSKFEIKSFQPQNFGQAASFQRHQSGVAGEAEGNIQKAKFDTSKFGSLAKTDPNSKSSFTLHPDARKHLGIDAEEQNHIEGLVAAEVEARLKAISDQAYAEGFQQGLSDGRVKAETDFSLEMNPMFERFTQLLSEFDAVKGELYSANEKMLVQMIFQMGKQIALKDITADRDYVKRLATTIIEKVGAKDTIRLKVSREDYAQLEQIRDFLKGQFPELKNIQIDASDEMVMGGCKVETDLSRINASVETQFQAIEKSLQEG